MALQSADHFFHWLKLATYCVGTPRIEEFASPIRTPVRPESLKVFLKHPSSHRLEVVLHQLAKLHSLLFVWFSRRLSKHQRECLRIVLRSIRLSLRCCFVANSIYVKYSRMSFKKTEDNELRPCRDAIVSACEAIDDQAMPTRAPL